MVSLSGDEAPGTGSRWLIPALGYVISAAALLWVYWGFDWRAELPRLAAADWRWVAFAMLADAATYFVQAWRWKVLLAPVARAGFWRSVQAIFVGLFANSILPLRSGELIRTYLQSLWSEIHFSSCLASVLIERLLDGVVLVAAFYAVSGSTPLPGFLAHGGLILALIVAVCSAGLAAVVFQRSRAHAVVRRSRWAVGLRHLVEGLHQIGRSPSFLGATLLSVAYFTVQLVPLAALAWSWDLGIPLPGLAVVLVILRVGTVLPQAPSNLGGVQFFTVVALGLFGVEKTTAAGFATVLFLVLSVPLWIAGAIASALAGIGIRDLQRHASRMGLAASGKGG